MRACISLFVHCHQSSLLCILSSVSLLSYTKQCKGVCYDTGGINLKGANGMKNMKSDMGGSAAALGTFLALYQTGSCALLVIILYLFAFRLLVTLKY